MIDIEWDVYCRIIEALEGLKNEFPKIQGNVSTLVSADVPEFPWVSIVERDNQVYRNTRDTGSNENHAQIVYEINVFTNSRTSRKADAKKIMSLLDETMLGMGFTRTMLSPVPNALDASIYRLAARYRALVSQNKVIYWR